MKNYKIKAKLLSSLIHTEETVSNIANIYRERVIIGDDIHSIPAIHGNSIRGQLRDLGAIRLLDTIEIENNNLPIDKFHILFSGGALTTSVPTIKMAEKMEYRRLCPFISLFGSALGGEMLQGKLSVGSGLPECSEIGTGGVSYHDMTEIVRYTRLDDNKRSTGEKYAKDGEQTQQMFYDIEVLKAGVILSFEIWTFHETELELGALHCAIKDLMNTKPFFGGKSSAGHGKVELDFKPDEALIDNYLQFLKNNKDDIKKTIIGNEQVQKAKGDSTPDQTNLC